MDFQIKMNPGLKAEVSLASMTVLPRAIYGLLKFDCGCEGFIILTTTVW
jgi:hypothetical protein